MNRSHAFHDACSSGLLDVVKAFVRANKKVIHVQDESEKKGIHFAILNDHYEVAKFLIAEGGYNANEDLSFDDALTILHFACIHDKLSIIQFLVAECGVDMEIENSSAWRAVHFASRNGHLDVVRYLVAGGNAIADTATTERLTALHLASRFRHLNVVQYLIHK